MTKTRVPLVCSRNMVVVMLILVVPCDAVVPMRLAVQRFILLPQKASVSSLSGQPELVRTPSGQAPLDP